MRYRIWKTTRALQVVILMKFEVLIHCLFSNLSSSLPSKLHMQESTEHEKREISVHRNVASVLNRIQVITSVKIKFH